MGNSGQRNDKNVISLSAVEGLGFFREKILRFDTYPSGHQNDQHRQPERSRRVWIVKGRFFVSPRTFQGIRMTSIDSLSAVEGSGFFREEILRFATYPSGHQNDNSLPR